jgi:hypothetical protein
MLKVMSKPENPFLKGLTIGGLFAGFFGIIHVIDTIMKWFKEGYMVNFILELAKGLLMLAFGITMIIISIQLRRHYKN